MSALFDGPRRKWNLDKIFFQKLKLLLLSSLSLLLFILLLLLLLFAATFTEIALRKKAWNIQKITIQHIQTFYFQQSLSRAGDTRRGRGLPLLPLPPLFSVAKKKKESKGKKINSFKAGTFKRLSPRSKC